MRLSVKLSIIAVLLLIPGWVLPANRVTFGCSVAAVVVAIFAVVTAFQRKGIHMGSDPTTGSWSKITAKPSTLPAIEFPCGCRLELPPDIVLVKIGLVECKHGNRLGPDSSNGFYVASQA